MGYNQNNAGMHYIRFNSEASKAADEFEWDNHCANRGKAPIKSSQKMPRLCDPNGKRIKAINALKKQNVEVNEENIELQMMLDSDYREGTTRYQWDGKTPPIKHKTTIYLTKPAKVQRPAKPSEEDKTSKKIKGKKSTVLDNRKAETEKKEKNASKQSIHKTAKQVANKSSHSDLSPGALGNDPRFKELFAQLLKGYEK